MENPPGKTGIYYWHDVNNEAVASDVQLDADNPIGYYEYITNKYEAPDGYSFRNLGVVQSTVNTISGTI